MKQRMEQAYNRRSCVGEFNKEQALARYIELSEKRNQEFTRLPDY